MTLSIPSSSACSNACSTRAATPPEGGNDGGPRTRDGECMATRGKEGAPRSWRLVLPYPISSNRYWRPVRIGSHITIVPTTEAKQYRADVAVLARSAGVRQPLAGRVAIDVELYPGRPKDWAKRARVDPETWDDTVRCIDLDNANKVLLDALKGIAIEDDRWVRRLVAERMEPDGEARVVVTITQLTVARAQGDLLGEAA